MRLHVVSDLHVEFGAFELPATDSDAVVLAGDTGLGIAGVQLARRWSRGPARALRRRQPRVLPQCAPGAHRRAAGGGGGQWGARAGERRGGAPRRALPGCTLWSDFMAAGEQELDRSMAVCARLLNDYEVITWSDGGRALRPADTRALHLASRLWLAERLAVPHDGPTVIVTHHAPLVRAQPASPVHRALVGAFASDLTELMDGDRRCGSLVIRTGWQTSRSGNPHAQQPRGYPHDPVATFDPTLIVEVD